jgi:hypothetical protein
MACFGENGSANKILVDKTEGSQYLGRLRSV